MRYRTKTQYKPTKNSSR